MDSISFSMSTVAREVPTDSRKEVTGDETFCETVGRIAYQIFSTIVYFFTFGFVDLSERVSEGDAKPKGKERLKPVETPEMKKIKALVPLRLKLLEVAVKYYELQSYQQETTNLTWLVSDLERRLTELSEELATLRSNQVPPLRTGPEDLPRLLEVTDRDFAKQYRQCRIINCVKRHAGEGGLDYLTEAQLKEFEDESLKHCESLLSATLRDIWEDQSQLESVENTFRIFIEDYQTVSEKLARLMETYKQKLSQAEELIKECCKFAPLPEKPPSIAPSVADSEEDDGLVRLDAFLQFGGNGENDS